MSVRELPDFNPKTKEDKLTKKLKVYVENYVARERGLLGMWAAENVIGVTSSVRAPGRGIFGLLRGRGER